MRWRPELRPAPRYTHGSLQRSKDPLAGLRDRGGNGKGKKGRRERGGEKEMGEEGGRDDGRVNEGRVEKKDASGGGDGRGRDLCGPSFISLIRQW